MVDYEIDDEMMMGDDETDHEMVDYEMIVICVDLSLIFFLFFF